MGTDLSKMPRFVPLCCALLALALTAPAAQACPGQLSRPFSPWLDFAQYTPAPGFEQGWTLDGATLADGGQPWGGGAQSLAIPAGASAVSPPVCVTPAHPTIRFFAKGTGALAVSVLADGLEVPVGAVAGTGTWAPTLVMPIVLNLLGEEQVQFRFAGALGDFELDDVWIDPYSKG
jgi:hypothetical protein